ncbi:MAG: carboxypeptidase-like regulatory domain-containing protein [bacterium]
MHRLLRAITASSALSLGALAAQAQGPDVVRGKATDDSSRAMAGVVVMVTRGPDRLTLQTTTDSAGQFRVRFEQGTGDYLVYMSAPGFKASRRRVQRAEGARGDLVANFTLARDLTLLAAMRVTADLPVRATTVIGPTQQEVGAAEKWSEGVVGQVAPSMAGDLSALAGTMQNITVTAAGPSILGSGPGSNLTTLNGMGFSAAAIPRAARTETRITGATFDPTRGGFSGANIDITLGPGSRAVQRRNGFITLDPSQLQFTDAVGRAVGAQQTSYRGSLGLDGELIRKAVTYNVALDFARSVNDPASLLNTDAAVLRGAGIAPDSIVRIVGLAPSLGLPLAPGQGAAQSEHLALTWLGRLDDTRDSIDTRAITTYLGYTRDGAVGLGPLIAPSASAERRDHTAGAQLILGRYIGPGRRILNDTRLSASVEHAQLHPYRALPTASLLVRSTMADATDVTGVTLGGSSSFATDDTRWTVEGDNETAWNIGGRRHRFKFKVWARADGLRQDGSVNQYGTFGFSSIADLAAGRASTFSRTLAQPAQSGTVWNAASAIAHQWAPTRFFTLLYGARLEADGFAQTPARNTALEQALGMATGVAPSRIHVSPRAGFTYTYNRDRTVGTTVTLNPVGRFYRAPSGVIRGGIGEFRDLLRPGILADASGATGLPGGASMLSCVGSAVPAIDWAQFAGNPASIPVQCLDGSGALRENTPAATLIDKGYDVPRSWRGSLDWSTNFGSWLVRLGGLASYDLAQPGSLDANFSGISRLTLSGDGNRPVYVTPSAIDAGSGAVSAAESRRSNQFGSVGVRASDLRGYGGQFTLNVAPDVFRNQSGTSYFYSTGYTLQWARRQYRGFDIAAFGDPRTKEWAPSVNDARHVVVLSGGFANATVGTITMFARAQSGLPFTPIVQGDVNGDGRRGDRAFIPNPIIETDQVLAQQVKALLANGASSAQDCLQRYSGQVAALNGCRAPWTQSLNVQWRPVVPARWGNRVTPSVYLQNVLAGVDQLAHGSGNLRGWGSSAALDPVLLIPRGYDVAAQRFRYDVNPRFADPRPGSTFLRQPFRVTVDFSLALSTNFDLQQLRRAVEPVRGANGWQLRSADSLTAFYLGNTSSIHKLLIEESDSLFLSTAQVAALRRADSAFSARVRELYAPLGAFLANGRGGAGDAELDMVRTTQKTYWKIFWEQPEIADAVITPTQRELMPLLKTLLNTPAHERERSTWQFAHPVSQTP